MTVLLEKQRNKKETTTKLLERCGYVLNLMKVCTNLKFLDSLCTEEYPVATTIKPGINRKTCKHQFLKSKIEKHYYK